MIALCLGGADTLHADIEEAATLVDPEVCTVIACNDAGFEWPGRLDHWASMHAEELPYRIQRRQQRGYPSGFTTWTRPYPFGMKEREKLCDRLISGWSGSSGLLCVGIARELGLHAILCGMPMDDRPHFNREGTWNVAESHRERWIELTDVMAPFVRSFSGWTAETFGRPTSEWVDAARAARVA